jgi:hypothetical protein
MPLTDSRISQPFFRSAEVCFIESASQVFVLHRFGPDRSRDSSRPKAAGAGLAGRPTLLSLADRDLFFQDRWVMAANGAPTPLAGVQPNLVAI